MEDFAHIGSTVLTCMVQSRPKAVNLEVKMIEPVHHGINMMYGTLLVVFYISIVTY